MKLEAGNKEQEARSRQPVANPNAETGNSNQTRMTNERAAGSLRQAGQVLPTRDSRLTTDDLGQSTATCH